ncbi:MAG TPA: hypothetical protein PLC09_11510 [Holophaga sp.]|nr:hypothetical protein [Holophaga sp.]
MIVSKPRQIRIDLDPDQGFPVAVSMESIRYVEEDGVKVADLPAHIESLPADSPQAAAVIGEMASSATAALVTYQQEVQRLAGEIAVANARVAELEATGAAPVAQP